MCEMKTSSRNWPKKFSSFSSKQREKDRLSKNAFSFVLDSWKMRDSSNKKQLTSTFCGVMQQDRQKVG
jgi:hypothetical protein